MASLQMMKDSAGYRKTAQRDAQQSPVRLVANLIPSA